MQMNIFVPKFTSFFSGTEISTLKPSIYTQVEHLVFNGIIFKHVSGSLSTQHGVILLRSTGTLLVKETPAERAAIFEDAWKQLQSIG